MTKSDHSTAPLESPDQAILRLEAGANAVAIDLALGNIAALDLGGIAPLHRAPWLDEPEVQADEAIPLVDRRLSGDFFCLPIGTGHEDFVTLFEVEGRQIGWTAILRETEGDIVFILKNARNLPLTMLWHSNGGRDYAPWNGRHRNVLGIEDGRAAGELGHAGALGPSVYRRNGIAVTQALGAEVVVPHVIGAMPCPQGWDRITDITVDGGRLTLCGGPGQEVVLPFEEGFLDLP